MNSSGLPSVTNPVAVDPPGVLLDTLSGDSLAADQNGRPALANDGSARTAATEIPPAAPDYADRAAAPLAALAGTPPADSASDPLEPLLAREAWAGVAAGSRMLLGQGTAASGAAGASDRTDTDRSVDDVLRSLLLRPG